MATSETVFERDAPPAGLVDATLAGARHGCFWIEDVEPAPTRPALAGDRRTDLAVVGGGYTGLWTAVRAKGVAISRFTSQIAPLSDDPRDATVLSDAVLARFRRDTEILWGPR